MKTSNYKDSIKVQFDTTLAQSGEFPYGTGTSKMTVKDDATITPKPDDGLNWWMNCGDDAKKASLLKKAYNFDKNGNNDHNLKNDNNDDDNNEKKDDTTEDEGNLVMAHIAGYDKMSGYEQVSALIDDGHCHHTKDDGYSFDIIGLHVTNIDASYKLNNVESTKSKEIESSQSNEFESNESNIVTVESNELDELVSPSVQQNNSTVREHKFFNFLKKEVNQILNPDFHLGEN